MTSYEYLNLLASYGGLGLLYYGIREMAKGAEMRAADSERKHTETMVSLSQSHDAFRELIEEQAESRMALRELIERTR